MDGDDAKGDVADGSSQQDFVAGQQGRDRESRSFVPLGVLAFFLGSSWTGSQLYDLPVEAWLPLGDAFAFRVGGCGKYIVTSPPDQLLQLAWGCIIVAAFVAISYRPAARVLATIGLTLAAVSAGVYGAVWIEQTLLGEAPLALSCPPPLTPEELVGADGYARYSMTQLATVAGTGVLLALVWARRSADDNKEQFRLRWWRVVVVVLLISVTGAFVGPIRQARAAFGDHVDAFFVLPGDHILMVTSALALTVLVPRGRVRRVGAAANKIALAFAFGQWALLIELVQRRHRILDPAASTASRLVFGSDLTAHQREALDLLLEYYVAVWLALSVLWISGQLVRRLLVHRIDDDVSAVASR